MVGIGIVGCGKIAQVRHIPEYLEHTATVTAITALGVANLDKPLPREGVYEEN